MISLEGAAGLPQNVTYCDLRACTMATSGLSRDDERVRTYPKNAVKQRMAMQQQMNIVSNVARRLGLACKGVQVWRESAAY